ncbi:MAG: DUF4012 domain-containing protein [Candidatus Kuenenbacteria bacterium]
MDKSKNNLEKNLEQLSWEFVLDVENAEKEDERVFLYEDEEEEEIEKREQIKENAEKRKQIIEKEENDNYERNSDIENFYQTDKNSFFGINDVNRNSGIIFDEEKLRASKVAEWTKAPRLKELKIKKGLIAVGRGLALPFILSAKGIFYFFKALICVFKWISLLAYKTTRALVFLPWQILLAFKASFIYLFGEFNWLENKSALPVYVKAKTSYIAQNSKWKAIGAFAVTAFLIVLPMQAYVLYRQGQETKGEVMGASLSGMEYMKQAGIFGAELSFDKAEEKFVLAEKDFSQAERSFNEFGAVAGKLAGLIPEVKTGQELLLVAGKSAQIGQHLSRVAEVFAALKIKDKQSEEGKTESSSDLSAIDEELKMALTTAIEVNDILQKVDLSKTEFGDQAEKFENIKKQLPYLLSFLNESRDIFKVITHFLGGGQTRRWMLVFQNNSELRPTGGFMGSYGIVDIKNGVIENIEVPGGGFYDLKGSLEVKVDAPYPFHLFSAVWQPWNANWFPSWPESARKIEWFYENSGGSTVDGVIAFTPNVLEDLLDLTGEIDMPEYGTNVNSQNFVRMAQMEVEFNYDKEDNKPKKFIGDLLPKVLERVMAVKDEKLFDMLDIITNSLNQKHLLVYFNDIEHQGIADNLDWTGKIKQTNGDYLNVVHTNVAGGKTDRVIETSILHEVEITEDGLAIGSVIVNKKHNGEPQDIFEDQANTDYLRIYVPQGSKLLKASGFDTMPNDRIFQIAAQEDGVAPDADLIRLETNLRQDDISKTRITDEFGKTVFGNWMIVKPGEQKSAKINYVLPFRFEKVEQPIGKPRFFDLVKQYFFGKQKQDEDTKDFTGQEEYIYSLLVQKQAGTENEKITSRLIMSPNWQIVNYLPESPDLSIDGDNLVYNGELEIDRYYAVEIRRKN